MNSNILIYSVVAGIAIAGLTWGYIKWKKKQIMKNRMSNQIPANVLADFEEAERRIKNTNGNKDPYTILWEIGKDRREKREREFPDNKGDGRDISKDIPGESTIKDVECVGERENIQTGVNPIAIDDKRDVNPVEKPNSNRPNLLSRLRSKFRREKIV